MEKAIRKILETIPSGSIFDSHFIIAQLIKHHSDTYLTFASSITATENKTLVVHGLIGKEIAKFKGSVIEHVSDLAWSENIHGNPSTCTTWEKIIK